MESQCWYGIEIEKKKKKKKRIQIKGVDLLSYEAITNAVIFIKSLELYRVRRSIIITYHFTQSVFFFTVWSLSANTVSSS